MKGINPFDILAAACLCFLIAGIVIYVSEKWDTVAKAVTVYAGGGF